MTVEFDTSSPKFAEYSEPGRLVTGAWLEEHLGTPGLVVVESDEDVLLYETGHIPGAVKVDWHTELNDPVVRDYVDGAGFAELLSRKGISRDDTVVIYGDKSNWWAAYALWVFSLFGHEDVRLLDGGRDKWIAEGRPITTEASSPSPTQYPVVERDDSTLRAYREDVLAHFGNPLIDVRSPEEYDGSRTSAPAYPEEGALRAGHIPSAKSVPWARAVAEDGGFKAARRAGRDLPHGRRTPGRRRHRRLLPDRRALEPHLVRAAPPARLRERAQLRRLVDRVGQRSARADRHGRRARRGPRPPIASSPGIPRVGECGRMTGTALPEALAEIRDEFLELAEPERLQLLLEYSNELPAVPSRYDDHPELRERVAECQSPVYIILDVDEDGRVAMHATAPREAPTTRGFASILVQGITGLTARRGARHPG